MRSGRLEASTPSRENGAAYHSRTRVTVLQPEALGSHIWQEPFDHADDLNPLGFPDLLAVIA